MFKDVFKHFLQPLYIRQNSALLGFEPTFLFTVNDVSRSGIFIVNFEHISFIFLVFLLLLWASICLLGFYDRTHLSWSCKTSKKRKENNFERKKGWNDHESTLWFWSREPSLGNPKP